MSSDYNNNEGGSSRTSTPDFDFGNSSFAQQMDSYKERRRGSFRSDDDGKIRFFNNSDADDEYDGLDEETRKKMLMRDVNAWIEKIREYRPQSATNYGTTQNFKSRATMAGCQRNDIWARYADDHYAYAHMNTHTNIHMHT